MLFLAIETSSVRGSLALFDAGRCAREEVFPEGLVHGRETTAQLQRLLDGAGRRPADLGAIAVSIGPGSYTGTRVGVTAAKTLALALGIPVLAVSTLEVLVRGAAQPSAASSRLVPLLDARRGYFYAASFDVEAGGAVVRVADDHVGRADDIRARLRRGAAVLGDGADLFLDATGGVAAEPELVRVAAEFDLPSARVLGTLASDEVEGLRFDRDAVHRLEPAYLRPSTPEIVRERQDAAADRGSERGD